MKQLGLIAACAVLAGAVELACGGDQPAGGGAAGFLSAKVNPGQTGFADFAPVLKPKVRWAVNLPPVLSHEAIQPVVAKGGKVFYMSAGGFLIQGDADKGTLLWKEKMGAIGHPVIRENMLYVNGAKFIKAFDIGGEKPVMK